MKNMKLCDVHTHVLPGVDDGAPTMEYALQMLQNAVASDVEALVVTPHCNGRYGDGNYLGTNLHERFSELQKAAEDIPLKLFLGAEVLADERLLSLLDEKKLPTINGGRYLLTEFPMDAFSGYIFEVLQGITERGYIPLIAHPERYTSVCRNPQIVMDWLDLGCHLQLTGGSIFGEYGKTVQKTANILLQQDLVACIASDSHGIHRRSNFLLDVCDHLKVRYPKQYAQCLMYENPMRICLNEDI